MEHVTVELDLSRDLLGTLQVTGQELEPELKLLIALEPFREETISCGKARRWRGRWKLCENYLGTPNRMIESVCAILSPSLERSEAESETPISDRFFGLPNAFGIPQNDEPSRYQTDSLKMH